MTCQIATLDALSTKGIAGLDRDKLPNNGDVQNPHLTDMQANDVSENYLLQKLMNPCR